MKTYIVGNWKMNLNVGGSSLYLQKIQLKMHGHRDVSVVVAPTALALQTLSLQLDRRKIKLAAQNLNAKDFGALTGEISANQLRGLVDYAIIGHSERRQIFHESNKDVKKKVAAALRNNITPILCVGETESEHEFGETADVIRDQLLSGVSDVSLEDLGRIIVAYEPVWAISTTTNAKFAAPDTVAAATDLVRGTLKQTFGKEVAEKIPVLYGGSVNPSNAGGYLTIPGINGLLVGGSSLILDHFLAIIETAKKIQQ